MPLLGLSLFLGFYPKPVLDRLEPTVDALVHHVEENSDYKQPAGRERRSAELVAEQAAAKRRLDECVAP